MIYFANCMVFMTLQILSTLLHTSWSYCLVSLIISSRKHTKAEITLPYLGLGSKAFKNKYDKHTTQMNMEAGNRIYVDQ